MHPALKVLLIIVIAVGGLAAGIVAGMAVEFGVKWVARRSRHFSMRDLLIAMTVVAVLLGAVVYAVK